VGTDPVRPVPGGTGPARYMNRSGSHPKPCLKFLPLSEPAGFLNRGNQPSHGSVNPAKNKMHPQLIAALGEVCESSDMMDGQGRIRYVCMIAKLKFG
jgi:hypothetical protein